MYTYDDFMNTANKAGMLSRFPEQELEAIRKNPELGISLVGLMQDQEKASTAEQRLLATEAANQLRKNYGLGTVAGAGANVVAGSYGDQYAGLLQGPVYQGSFAYDPEKDPVWSAYKKQYAREGERAGENAMAQAAAMTGGRPSSYAVTAGQQAGNYYAGQMSDIIPELANDAYQRYIYEQQLKQQNFENALMIRDALGYTPDWAAEILGIESTETEDDPGKREQHTDPVDPVDPTDPEDSETGGDYTLDMNSIAALGYGPMISEKKLDELISSGEVREVIDGNVIRFEKVPKAQNGNLWDFTKELMDKADKSSKEKPKEKKPGGIPINPKPKQITYNPR